jgi:hypothetical protein
MKQLGLSNCTCSFITGEGQKAEKKLGEKEILALQEHQFSFLFMGHAKEHLVAAQIL